MNASTISPGEVFVIVPPRISAMMTGVTMVQQDRSRLTTLIYEDGERESAVLGRHLHDAENFFSLVGEVQDKARRDARA